MGSGLSFATSELSLRRRRSSGMRVAALVLVGTLSLAFVACKDDPVTPPPMPVVNKVDTVRHALSISPDSSAEIFIHSSPVFRLSAMPSLPKPYSIVWTIDTQVLSRLNADTIAFRFDVGLRHSVKAVYIDSIGSRRDSITSLLKIKDSTILPNDTTSNDFVWKEFTSIKGESNMTGCWVFSSTNVLAVNGSLHRFDGTSWSDVLDSSGKPFGNGGLSGYSIFAFSDNDFWLIGSANALHYTGDGKYHPNPTFYLNHAGIHSAWGTSSSNLYVVGDSGLVVHYNGSNWTKMSTPTKKRLDAISGSSDHDIWASGYDPFTAESEVLHYDGLTWTEDIITTSGTAYNYGLDGVFECDSVGHKVYAIAGSTVFRRTDNGSWWKDATVPNGDHIGIGISGQSANDLFALGGWGVVAHWSGKSWKRYDQFYEPNNPLYGAGGSCYRNNTLCVVGIKNGTSWVLIGQRQ